jgi:tRNA (guanine-N7-)-methyltransferase
MKKGLGMVFFLAHKSFSLLMQRGLYRTLKTKSFLFSTAHNHNKPTESSIIKTSYTITTPPYPQDQLRALVTRHVQTLDLYLASRPGAAHTRLALEQLAPVFHANNNQLILDSGCGTGRSSLALGEMYPNATIVGIDRSIVRLEKNARYNSGIMDGSSDNDSSVVVQQVADNVWLVRAELVQVWAYLWTHNIPVYKHYVLYPNPYPKYKRIQSRWYGHAAFPLLLHVAGKRLVVRSNWEQYLIEFATAVDIAKELGSRSLQTSGPLRRDSSKRPAWTNFEAKYDAVNEATYELIVEPFKQ